MHNTIIQIIQCVRKQDSSEQYISSLNVSYQGLLRRSQVHPKALYNFTKIINKFGFNQEKKKMFFNVKL